MILSFSFILSLSFFQRGTNDNLFRLPVCLLNGQVEAKFMLGSNKDDEQGKNLSWFKHNKFTRTVFIDLPCDWVSIFEFGSINQFGFSKLINNFIQFEEIEEGRKKKEEGKEGKK